MAALAAIVNTMETEAAAHQVQVNKTFATMTTTILGLPKSMAVHLGNPLFRAVDCDGLAAYLSGPEDYK